MGTLFNLAQYRKAKSVVHFDRTELMQLMNTYSRQVASGALHSGEKIKQSSEIQNVLDAVEKRARKVVPLFKSR